MSGLRASFAVLLALAVVALLALPVTAQVTPSVTVVDQPIVDGTVTVASVVSDGPGWIVIHRQEGDSFGALIGFAPVQDGENTDVVVEIDVAQATETLYAMLHADTGTEGQFEFPGGDPPVTVDGQIVSPPFRVTGGLEAQQEATATPEAETPTPEAEATPQAEATATATPAPALPVTGTGPSSTSWATLALVLGAVLLLGGIGLSLAMQRSRTR
ncbi:MAG: hypothetical protein HPY83_09215 [Anaerolineae bacterium]|nr:hypothetical protein [Anaerolineae bacterium]